MTKDRFRLARIVIAVVIEKNDLPADFRLQAPGGKDFGGEKSLRKDPAGLLAETDDRRLAHGSDGP
jgi:hypothetical protein